MLIDSERGVRGLQQPRGIEKEYFGKWRIKSPIDSPEG